MITIIGGGVFGLSIGWYLARAGCTVIILEKDRVGRGATWVAAGMLMPWKLSNAFSDDLFALQREGHRLWPDFAEMLSACSAIDIHYQTEGRYFVALDDKAVKRFRRQFNFHRKAGFPLEWLSGDEAWQRVPALGPNVQAAMFSPMGHWVDNRALIEALGAAFLQAGGVLREGAEVTEILIEQEQVRGVCAGNETVPTEIVILAAGAQLAQIGDVPENLCSLIQPLKGQSITLQMNPAEPLIEQTLIGPVYLVPRVNGQLIIGTTVEEDAGFDTSPTVGGMLDILGKAQEIVPGIKELSVVEMIAGTRPTGPNRLPVLGPTSIHGLIVASGGHSYGILLAPIVAQSITEIILTGKTSDIIKPFKT